MGHVDLEHLPPLPADRRVGIGCVVAQHSRPGVERLRDRRQRSSLTRSSGCWALRQT
jgi:hypothetical protein